MIKTKEKILNSSLKLFNKYGLAKVTLRTIAKEVGISQGNLNYHFKKRDEIIEALYFQLVKNIDKSMVEIKPKEINLKLLLDLIKSIMVYFYTYRFFLLDFVQIIKENKVIKKHYLELSELRENQFLEMITILKVKKIMWEEKLPNEHNYLCKRLQILSDFWISSAEIESTQISIKTISKYSDIIIQEIYPYLTAKGKKEFHSLQ
ncbi:MAG: TetR/AcrR family transcriptional regulator [Melioribacteraceae bacterium]|nr:TetR/AcrR family transcriptional regulator [Melioribacteraceae bacterium]